MAQMWRDQACSAVQRIAPPPVGHRVNAFEAENDLGPGRPCGGCGRTSPTVEVRTDGVREGNSWVTYDAQFVGGLEEFFDAIDDNELALKWVRQTMTW